MKVLVESKEMSIDSVLLERSLGSSIVGLKSRCLVRDIRKVMVLSYEMK